MLSETLVACDANTVHWWIRSNSYLSKVDKIKWCWINRAKWAAEKHVDDIGSLVLSQCHFFLSFIFLSVRLSSFSLISFSLSFLAVCLFVSFCLLYIFRCRLHLPSPLFVHHLARRSHLAYKFCRGLAINAASPVRARSPPVIGCLMTSSRHS